MNIDMDTSAFTIVTCKDRMEWLAERKKYVGASDASAVLGISPWNTNVQLWEDKRTPLDSSKVELEPPNDNMLRGIKSESHIRELYAVESGDKCVDGAGMILVSKEYPWMSATLDGICIDKKTKENYSLEIKSCQWNSHWRKECPPDHYVTQVIHQLAVTKWPRAILHARLLMPDGDVRETNYEFFYDEWSKSIERLANTERMFMSLVKSGERPPEIMPSL